MRKKALRKDFFTEITHTLPRFLSIFAIVLLGVAFFSGIRAGEPDMRYSNDAYLDSHNLFDIRVVSTLGLTDDDLTALRGIDGVSDAQPGWSTDLLSDVDDDQLVLHVESIIDGMNTPDVSDGRLPQTPQECLLDQAFAEEHDLSVGDTLTLTDENGDPSGDLTSSQFTVVGIGSSPEYISFSRGSSTVGHGEADGFLLVCPEAFSMDAYTHIDLSVAGAKELTAFTPAYDDAVNTVLSRVEDIEQERCDIRYEQVVSNAQQSVLDAQNTLNTASEEVDQELDAASQKLEDAKDALASARTAYETGLRQWQTGNAEIQKQAAALSQAKETFQAAEQKLQSGRTELESRTAQLQAAEQTLANAQSAYQKGQDTLATLQTELDGVEQQIADLQNQGQPVPDDLIAYRDTLQSQVTQLSAKLAEASQKIQEESSALAQANETLAQAKTELDGAEKTLAEKKSQLDAGEQALAAGQQALGATKAKLDAAKAQLSAAGQQIETGEEAYLQGQQEATQQLNEGQQKIAEAQQQINEVSAPTWMVDSRDTLPDYTECGENADRIRAIGEVFPVIFFLVAALICLTTMNRMVEEERVQIGTLKALGYGRWSIAKKYLYYAFLATLGGSICGILIGEKVIPYVIVTAYKIVYPAVPDVVIPYQWGFGLLATGAAVLCTTLAALISCQNALRAQPASLMRPAPPKQGKRILLERLKPLWKRLSFSQKATFRNLSRYKRRLFMTVFGIGGCMALMVVGFGLKDSVSDIANLQFGSIQQYTGMVILNSGTESGDLQQMKQALESDDGVTAFAPMLMDSVDITGSDGEQECELVCPEQKDGLNGFISLHSRTDDETYTLDDSGVILTEKFAKTIGAKAGDTVTLSYGGQEATATVSHITENYLYHYCYISPELFSELFGIAPSVNTIAFQTPDGVDSRAVGQRLLQVPCALSVTYLDSMQKQVDDMLSSLNIVIAILIISAGLLAFVVLYNLNNININERRRELASIKVLGFTDLELAGYVYRENIYLTLLGIILGVFLGGFLHQFVITTVEIDSCMFGRTIYPLSYLLSTLLTVLFSVVVNWVMYFKLKKIDMVESLKSVE